MAARNNQAVAQQAAPVQQVVQQTDLVLSPEEYQAILNQRAAKQQAPVQQAAPVVQETQIQEENKMESKEEKKAKLKKAGKTVFTATVGAGVGAAVTAAIFLVTGSEKAAEDAAVAITKLF